MKPRSTVAAFAVVCLLSFVAETKAQEGSLPLSVSSAINASSSVSRTPMMVVHDAALPVPEPAKLLTPAPKGKLNTATAAHVKANAEATADATAPNPIVIPAPGSAATSGEPNSLTTT